MQITLLGDFRLAVDGQAQPVRAQKSKALLAWLACHADQPQPRERLAGLLWGDRTAENGKASLRQALAGLRKLLPEGCLHSQGDSLSLERSVVDSDIDRFRAWRKAADDASLEQALALYRGDLLDGLQIRSQVFDEWLLLEREALRRDALTGFDQLMVRHQSQSEWDQAIAVGSRLLSLDPLQEAVHQRLMQLYVARGQLGSAQRQFKLCCEVLQRELNVPPAPETVALFQSLGDSRSKQAAQPAAVTESTAAPAQPAATTEPADPGSLNRRATLPSIAVLPFRSMSSQPDHEYLADGMTEELINLLANSANWRVSARNLSFRYKDSPPDARAVGKELGVGYVIEGSIRAMAQQARISVALVSAIDGTQLWSDRYDRPLAELFDVQDEMVHAIFRTLKNRLGFAERERVRRTPKTNLDAWGLLMKAMQVSVTNAETASAQRALILESLQIDPDYPRAHAYLASTLFTAVGRGTSLDRKADAALGAQHAEAALAAGAADSVVLRMCAGGFAAIGQTQHALALAEQAYEMTRSPDPLLVAVLMWSGRLDEAMAFCEQVVAALPPNVPSPPGELRPLALLGNLHLLQDNLEEALLCALKDQRANPGNYFTHVNVANIYGFMGQVEPAQASWNLATRIVPQLTVAAFAGGYARVFTDSALGARLSDGLVAAGLE
ncbi:MAG: BTAD domain-containing putative transcriptional regulator [Pseudomonadales bacterium]